MLSDGPRWVHPRSPTRRHVTRDQADAPVISQSRPAPVSVVGTRIPRSGRRDVTSMPPIALSGRTANKEPAPRTAVRRRSAFRPLVDCARHRRQNALVPRRLLVAALLALSCWVADRIATCVPDGSLAPTMASQHHDAAGGASAPQSHDDARFIGASIPAASSRSQFQHVAATAAPFSLFVAAVRQSNLSLQRTHHPHPGLRDIPLLI